MCVRVRVCVRVCVLRTTMCGIATAFCELMSTQQVKNWIVVD